MTNAPDRNNDMPDGMSRLESARAEIESIDRELMDLFTRRMAAAREVAAFKAANDAPVFISQREEAIVRKVLLQVSSRDATRAEILMRSLMRLSRGAQYDSLLEKGVTFDMGDRIAKAPRNLPELNRIVYQGNAASYAAAAARRLFPGVNADPVDTWEDACREVLDEMADLAVLPLENTTAGTVDEVYDLLVKYNLHIWRTLSLPIQHCLVGTADSTLSDIRTVISHPQALSQCSDFIRDHGWEMRESPNTAFAADEVARRAQAGLAAIASEMAAEDSRLHIISRDICNSRVNQTRFVAVGRTLRITPDAGRISLALRLPHQSGALAATLAVFGDRGLNLTKIESRPDLDNPWSYLFYLDFECPADRPEPVLATLLQLEREMPMLQLLGWYHEED